MMPEESLAEIYGWFTEGFDTADLQQAKILASGIRINKETT